MSRACLISTFRVGCSVPRPRLQVAVVARDESSLTNMIAVACGSGCFVFARLVVDEQPLARTMQALYSSELPTPSAAASAAPPPPPPPPALASMQRCSASITSACRTHTNARGNEQHQRRHDDAINNR